MKATVHTEKGKTMTDYQRLVDFFMDEIPEGSPFAGKIKHLVEKLLAEGVTFQTWIPVTERLPEVGGIYLVVVKYKYDFEKEFTYDTDVATFHFGYGCGYIDGQWNTYVDWDEGQQYIHVTHWMPLPEPPKYDL